MNNNDLIIDINWKVIDFNGHLDRPINFNGDLHYLLNPPITGKDPRVIECIKEAARDEIQARAIEYAHKFFAGYIHRVKLANETVDILMKRLFPDFK